MHYAAINSPKACLVDFFRDKSIIFLEANLLLIIVYHGDGHKYFPSRAGYCCRTGN